MSRLRFLDSVKKMPVMALPVRSILVDGKKSILISPGSNLTRAQLESCGSVDEIVGNNLFHCAGMAGAAAAFPKARVWGPVGAKVAKPDLPWQAELTEETWPYHEQLPMVVLKGMPKVQESVFVHRPSKTLIAADFAFNMTGPASFGSWLILHLFGTYKRFAVSKFYAKFVEDRGAFQQSLVRLFELDFDSMAMSHGELVVGGAKEKLKAALKERGFF
ncbi:MAG: hypothetical protein AB7F86_12245 [Bdellovibrionales bacterium]